MKYRALLIVPDATRETKPEQVYGDTLAALEGWASMKIADAPAGSEVVIYETIERPVSRFTLNLDGTSKVAMQT